MHLMRENWTDARLDELNDKADRIDRKVDRGFEKMDDRFEKMDDRFEKVYDKFDALYRVLIQGLFALVVAMIGGFSTLLAAIIWV